MVYSTAYIDGRFVGRLRRNFGLAASRAPCRLVVVKFSGQSGDDFDYSQLARVADRLLTPVAVIGSDSTLRYINGVAAQLFESDPEALIGQRMLSLVHPRRSSARQRRVGERHERRTRRWLHAVSSSRDQLSAVARRRPLRPQPHSTTPTCAGSWSRAATSVNRSASPARCER